MEEHKKCCDGKGVEPNVANPQGVCMACGAERFGIDTVAQAFFEATGEFLPPE